MPGRADCPLQRCHLCDLQCRRLHHDQVGSQPRRPWQEREATAKIWGLRRLFPPSSGRDKICTVWDLQSLQATKTVPVFEVGVLGPLSGAGWGSGCPL